MRLEFLGCSIGVPGAVGGPLPMGLSPAGSASLGGGKLGFTGDLLMNSDILLAFFGSGSFELMTLCLALSDLLILDMAYLTLSADGSTGMRRAVGAGSVVDFGFAAALMPWVPPTLVVGPLDSAGVAKIGPDDGCELVARVGGGGSSTVGISDPFLRVLSELSTPFLASGSRFSIF